MKKFVLALLALIAVLAIILYLKMNRNIPSNSFAPVPETPSSSFANTPNSSDFSSTSRSSGYSSEDIEKLILKGKETINKEDNVYYESGTKNLVKKHYYTGSKMKIELYFLSSNNLGETAEKSLTTISNFNEHITDKFDHTSKTRSTVSYAIGSKNLFQEELIDLIEDNRYITKFIYVKDDVLNGKDCIVVKAIRYDAKTYEMKAGSINAYWIEKSTGFYAGDTSFIKPNENPSSAASTLKNLSFGTVKDSDLAEPKL